MKQAAFEALQKSMKAAAERDPGSKQLSDVALQLQLAEKRITQARRPGGAFAPFHVLGPPCNHPRRPQLLEDEQDHLKEIDELEEHMEELRESLEKEKRANATLVKHLQDLMADEEEAAS